MRRPLAIAAVAGTVLAGGTAIAAAGGGPFDRVFGDRKDRDAELARELASRLDGVSADQVQGALEDLRRDKQSAWRKEEAAALAKHLDGVSAADVDKAFEKAERQLEGDRSRDRRPRRVDFVATLAKELGKSKSEVRKAFQAAHKERFEAKLDEAVKSGHLTKEQAAQIRKRFENGPPAFRKRHRGSGRHHGFRHGPGFAPPGLGPGGFEGPGPEGPPPQMQ